MQKVYIPLLPFYNCDVIGTTWECYKRNFLLIFGWTTFPSDNITCYALCLQKKTKEVLSLIVAHYQSLENDVRAQIQLEHEVEQEKIRKVSKRFPR
jgi:hypothetical protein